ncbi:phage tail tape measure protein [Phocaeicola barnesiae]|uniref:phage tail tape measure protein n=1 Tax=Phocaeicola barnesiae TaxID=376804 RepID=UPI00241C67EC|nr:phage tail tape measure protein [Phocaeicola barnesiae]
MAIDQVATVEVRVNGEEAKQELKNLEAIASGLKKELADAYKAGDTSKIKQVTSELRKTEAQIKTLKKDTTALTEVMNNLDKATPKELRATLTAINRQLNSGHIKRGSAEWKYYQQQAKQVTDELQKIKTEVQETEGWLTSFNNGLSKWGGLLATGAATITGMSMALNTLRKNRDSKESSQAELKALTGLDDSSIQWLTEQAERLSTAMDESGLRIRQSSDEILQAYMLIGSKKPELLKDKEALNAVTIEAMRLAAAAKIDLKDAVTATTVSLNMYGESADQAARYVNVLAAGSKEGAADVSAQAAAIKNAGVAAAGAGVSIEGLQGTIQMLAEKGLEAEPAGTALRKFFLVLQTGPDETNPKVVGLQTALENLNKKSLTAAQIQAMFGEEAFSAATILIDNADKVQQYTEAVTDTNIAMEQAAINSDTNEAKMAQYRNRIKEAGIELAERLNPSLSMLTGWTTKIITTLPTLIDWFVKYKGTVIGSAAALAGLIAYKKVDVAWSKLQVLWNEKVLVSLGNLFKLIKANPWAFLIVGVAAVVGKLIDLKREQDALTESQKTMARISKESAEKYTEQEARIRMLSNTVNNSNFSYRERLRCLNELKDIVPGYNATLDEEGRLMNSNTDAIKDYLIQLEKQIKMEAAREELAELYKKQRKMTNEQKELEVEVKDAKASVNAANFAASRRSQGLGTSGTRALSSGMDAGVRQATDRLNKANQALSKTKQQLQEINQAIKDVNNEIAQNTIISPNTEDIKTENPTPVVPVNQNDDKKENPLVIAENKRYYDELADLKKSYLASDEMTQQEYTRFMEDLEMRHLENMMAIAGLEPEKRQQIEQKILEMRIKFKEECARLEQEDANKASEEAFTRMEKQYQLEVQEATRKHYDSLSSEEEYYQELEDIQRKYYEDVLNSTQISEKRKSEIQQQIEKQNLSKSEKNYNEHKEKVRSTLQMAQEIGKEFGTTFADLVTDSEATLGDYMKATVNLILETLQKIMIASIAETQIKNITSLGFLGLAKAAGEVALITAAFETAKALIGSFYTGGYTGDGRWDEPRGVVHAGEFVANRYAVSNPEVRPVLDLIDQAQRNNTIGSLKASDISMVSNPVIYREPGQTIIQQDEGLIIMLRHTNDVITKLSKKLDEPILTYTKATGKMGINEAQKLVKKMNNNASRLKI